MKPAHLACTTKRAAKTTARVPGRKSPSTNPTATARIRHHAATSAPLTPRATIQAGQRALGTSGLSAALKMSDPTLLISAAMTARALGRKHPSIDLAEIAHPQHRAVTSAPPSPRATIKADQHVLG